MTTPRTTPYTENPESMAELLGDCHRMAPHWMNTAPVPAKPQPHPRSAEAPQAPGIHVPPKSAAALRGMAEYGA